MKEEVVAIANEHRTPEEEVVESERCNTANRDTKKTRRPASQARRIKCSLEKMGTT